MGYYVDVVVDNLIIPAGSIDECLRAITALHGVDGSKSFAWVNAIGSHQYKDLLEAFSNWRYQAEMQDGDVVVVYFRGEKAGSHEELFRCVAPFTRDGETATITYRGEDGCRWRYVIENQKFLEENARITWE